MSGSVVAGIGCRRGCAAEDIMAVVRRAADAAGRDIAALATPAAKADEPGVIEAAARLSLPLIRVGPDSLAAAQARCATHSARVARAVGVGSVAEGSALAAAGAGGRLLLARIASATATCALAEAAPA